MSDKIKTKSIKQEVIIDANPNEVYDAFMNSERHSEFTGAEAQIEDKIGGKISAWDEYIEGENVELIPGKKIVQRWRAADWPENHYSIATFEFGEAGGKTRIKFTQTGVPEENHDSIEQGWNEYYWNPLKEYFA